MNSISNGSGRRTSSRVVIIPPAGMWTVDKLVPFLLSPRRGSFRTVNRQHLSSYSFHQTTSSDFNSILQSLWAQKGGLLPLKVPRAFATIAGFSLKCSPPGIEWARYYNWKIERISFSNFFFSQLIYSMQMKYNRWDCFAHPYLHKLVLSTLSDYINFPPTASSHLQAAQNHAQIV